jgi:hypothetical protein
MKKDKYTDLFPGALEAMILRTLKRQPCAATLWCSTLSTKPTCNGCFRSKGRSTPLCSVFPKKVGQSRAALLSKYREREVSMREGIKSGLSAGGES